MRLTTSVMWVLTLMPAPEIDVLALCGRDQACQRRREHFVTFGFEQVGDAPPAPAAVPGAVNEDEGVAV